MTTVTDRSATTQGLPGRGSAAAATKPKWAGRSRAERSAPARSTAGALACGGVVMEARPSKPRTVFPIIAALAVTAAASWALSGAGSAIGASGPAGTGGPGAAGAADSPAPAGAETGGAVVLELFTSQGCSTCPPADLLLSDLGRDGSAGPVVPLAFHVDYWDRLGWSDPFSSRRWSERQEGYARALGKDNVATPQLVIDGRAECVGSRRDEVLRKIAEARAQQSAARVDLSLGAIAGSGAHSKLRVKVSVLMLRQAAGADPDVWVALTQSGLSTEVKSGENASRTLRDDFVVRRLQKALTVSRRAGSRREAELDLALDPAWPPATLMVAAFAQDPRSRAIIGAAASHVAQP
jgi:hypothetical protein